MIIFISPKAFSRYIEINNQVPMKFEIKVSPEVLNVFCFHFFEKKEGTNIMNKLEIVSKEMDDTWLREYDYCGKYLIEGRFIINSSNNNVILLIIGYAAEYVFDCNLKENMDDTKALFDAAGSLYTKELGNNFFKFIASLCFAHDHLDTPLTS